MLSFFPYLLVTLLTSRTTAESQLHPPPEEKQFLHDWRFSYLGDVPHYAPTIGTDEEEDATAIHQGPPDGHSIHLADPAEDTRFLHQKLLVAENEPKNVSVPHVFETSAPRMRQLIDLGEVGDVSERGIGVYRTELKLLQDENHVDLRQLYFHGCWLRCKVFVTYRNDEFRSGSQVYSSTPWRELGAPFWVDLDLELAAGASRPAPKTTALAVYVVSDNRLRPPLYRKRFDFYLAGGLVRPVELRTKNKCFYLDNVLPQVATSSEEAASHTKMQVDEQVHHHYDLMVFYDLAQSSEHEQSAQESGTSRTQSTSRTCPSRSEIAVVISAGAVPGEDFGAVGTTDGSFTSDHGAAHQSMQKMHTLFHKVNEEGTTTSSGASSGSKNYLGPVPSQLLWSPERPQLVELQLDVVVRGTNKILDSFVDTIGLRALSANGNQQVEVNGEATLLKGVNRHDNFFLAHDAAALYDGLVYTHDVLRLLDPVHSSAPKHMATGTGSGGPLVTDSFAAGQRGESSVDESSTAGGKAFHSFVANAWHTQGLETVFRGLEEGEGGTTSARSVLSRERRSEVLGTSTDDVRPSPFVDVTLHVSRTTAWQFLRLLQRLGLLEQIKQCFEAASPDARSGGAGLSVAQLFGSTTSPSTINGKRTTCLTSSSHAFLRHFLTLLRDVLLIKDLNANFVRGSHYSQNDIFLQLCDVFGLLVWEETMSWQASKKDVALPRFQAAQLQAMAGTVVAHRTRASVAVWGFLNEVDAREERTRVKNEWSEAEKIRVYADLDDEAVVNADARLEEKNAAAGNTYEDADFIWEPTPVDSLTVRSLLPRSSFRLGKSAIPTELDAEPPRTTTRARPLGDRRGGALLSAQKPIGPHKHDVLAVKDLISQILQVCAHYDPAPLTGGPLSATSTGRRSPRHHQIQTLPASSRFRSFASRYKQFDAQDVYDLVDLVVFNDYPGWYDLSTDLAETVTSFRELSRLGHQVQARSTKPVLVGETGGGGFVGFITEDKALTWSEERQALIVALAILAILYTEEAFAGICLWQFADQFINTLNIGNENIAAKILGLTTAIESTEWVRDEKPFAFRPNGLNNKGLFSHDRRYAKLAVDVVKSLFHPLAGGDVAFQALEQISARVAKAKHGKAFLVRNAFHGGWLAVHWWNDMDAHDAGSGGYGAMFTPENGYHEQVQAGYSAGGSTLSPPAFKVHTHRVRNRAGVWEAIGIRAAKNHLAISLRLIGHEDERTELLQGVTDAKNSFIFLAADDVQISRSPSKSVEVIAAFNDGGVAAHFQVGLEQELFSENGFPAEVVRKSEVEEILHGDPDVCLARGLCELRTTEEKEISSSETKSNEQGTTRTREFDPWRSSYFALESRNPRASQIQTAGRLGLFLVGSEAGRESKGELHLAARKPGFERDEQSFYLGLQEGPEPPDEFWWDVEFV